MVVVELRWMRNCSAMSLSSFLEKDGFIIYFVDHSGVSTSLPGKEEVKVTLKIPVSVSEGTD